NSWPATGRLLTGRVFSRLPTIGRSLTGSVASSWLTIGITVPLTEVNSEPTSGSWDTGRVCRRLPTTGTPPAGMPPRRLPSMPAWEPLSVARRSPTIGRLLTGSAGSRLLTIGRPAGDRLWRFSRPVTLLSTPPRRPLRRLPAGRPLRMPLRTGMSPAGMVLSSWPTTGSLSGLTTDSRLVRSGTPAAGRLPRTLPRMGRFWVGTTLSSWPTIERSGAGRPRTPETLAAPPACRLPRRPVTAPRLPTGTAWRSWPMIGRLLTGRLESRLLTWGIWAAGTSLRTSLRPGTLIPGIATDAEAAGVPDVTGRLFGVVTETPPGFTATEAPVPGTEAETDGMAEETIGIDGIGSSTLAEGTVPEVSAEA